MSGAKSPAKLLHLIIPLASSVPGRYTPRPSQVAHHRPHQPQGGLTVPVGQVLPVAAGQLISAGQHDCENYGSGHQFNNGGKQSTVVGPHWYRPLDSPTV